MKYRAVIVGFTVVLVALALVGMQRVLPKSSSSIREALSTWIGSGASVTTFDFTFESLAEQMARGSGYEGRVNIGAPPRPGFLNLYAIRRAALEASHPSLACGCAYVPEVDSVICDAEFLDRFPLLLYQDARDLSPVVEHADDAKAVIADLNNRYSAFLRAWAIGHEIGHFMLGHGRRSAPRGLSVFRAAFARGGDEVPSSLETDADVFMISRLSDRYQLQLNAYFALSQFATQLYGELMRQQYPDEKNRGPIFGRHLDVEVEFDERHHPHWLLRATRLANILIDYYPKIEDTSGYFRSIESHVRRAKSPFKSAHQCIEPEPTPTLPTQQSWFSFLGEAELINRLVSNGHYDLAKRRIVHLVSNYPKDPSALSILAYAELFTAWADLAKGDVDAARKTLEPLGSKADPIMRQIIDDDAGISLMNLRVRAKLSRALGTVERDRPDLEKQLERTLELLEEATEKDAASERQLANIYRALWQFSVSLDGLSHPRTMDFLQETANRDGGPGFNRDFAMEWLAEIRRLPEPGRVDGLSKADHLLYLRNYLSARGMRTEAVEIGLQGLALLDRVDPSLRQLRAAYRVNVARDIWQLHEYERAVPLLREAVHLRTEHAETIPHSQQPDYAKAWHEVAITANELGFGRLLARDPEKAIEALTVSLKVSEKLTPDDHEGLGTVAQNLAQSYLAAGDYKNALTFARRAVADREKAGVDAKLQADSALTLAVATLYAGDKQRGESLLADAVEKFEWAYDARLIDGRGGMYIGGKLVPLSDLLGEKSYRERALQRLTVSAPANRQIVARQVRAELEAIR